MLNSITIVDEQFVYQPVQEITPTIAHLKFFSRIAILIKINQVNNMELIQDLLNCLSCTNDNILTEFKSIQAIMSMASFWVAEEDHSIKVNWNSNNNDDFQIEDKVYNITMLSNVYQQLVTDAERLLDKLMFTEYAPRVLEYPSIIKDDIGNSEFRYSFLHHLDDENLTNAVTNNLCSNEELLLNYFEINGGSMTPIAAKFKNYLKIHDKFIEILLTLLHFTGGGPPRATEFKHLTIYNSQFEKRSIFIHEGLLMICPSYNKTRANNQHEKLVARYINL